MAPEFPFRPPTASDGESFPGGAASVAAGRQGGRQFERHHGLPQSILPEGEAGAPGSLSGPSRKGPERQEIGRGRVWLRAPTRARRERPKGTDLEGASSHEHQGFGHRKGGSVAHRTRNDPPAASTIRAYAIPAKQAWQANRRRNASGVVTRQPRGCAAFLRLALVDQKGITAAKRRGGTTPKASLGMKPSLAAGASAGAAWRGFLTEDRKRTTDWATLQVGSLPRTVSWSASPLSSSTSHKGRRWTASTASGQGTEKDAHGSRRSVSNRLARLTLTASKLRSGEQRLEDQRLSSPPRPQGAGGESRG